MNWLQGIRNRYRVSDDPLRTLRRIELLAVLLGLLVCLQLAYGGVKLATMAAPEPVEPAADSLQVPLVLAPALVASGERNEIVSRPLFWGGRRPLAAVTIPPEAEGKPGELKGVKLVGVFGSGDQAGIIALVKGKKRRILLGEAVEGWILKSIQPAEIVVANGARTETLVLQHGKVKGAPASVNGAGGSGGQANAYPQPDSQSHKSVSAAAAAGSASEPKTRRRLVLGPR
jgi:hypothetical protein